jgi:hypothetical protein
MLEKYEETQPLFYSFFTKEIQENKVFHSYLLETKGLSYGNEAALDLAKLIFSFDDQIKENDYFLMENNSFPDLTVINTDGKNIKKDYIKELQIEFNNKPLYSKYKIYIINDIEFLNPFSANTLLKFIEEPDENIIAILTCKNMGIILDTIISRCQTFSFINDKIDNFTFDNINLDEIIEFYVNLEEQGLNLLSDKKIYNIKDDLNDYLTVGLYFYYDLLNIYFNRIVKVIDEFKKEKNKIVNCNNKDVIIKKIILINDYLNKMKMSAIGLNKDIFIDNFVIDMGGTND